MVKQIIYSFLVAGGIIGCTQQKPASKAEVVQLEVQKVQNSAPVTAIQSVGGFVGDRLEKNKENYIRTFPIEEHVEFIEERTHTGWDWKKAEQPGKWVESAILTAKRTGDKELEQKAREMLNRLIASQEPGGYVGATSPEIRSAERPLRGMDAYELYFLQHAFLTAYEQLNEPEALEAAKKLGDYFVKYIGPGKAEFWPTEDRYPENVGKVYRGTVHSKMAGHSLHYSWEGSLLIDPMLRLYQMTGDDRYLDWSKWVISRIDEWSGWNSFSKLDSVAAGTMDINEIQPYVHSHTFQMNFLGFLRMYQITGDQSYFRKVAGAWDDVAERQMYITGGVGVGEHYERDYIKPLTGEMVETCATMSWLQLSQNLLELTGDTRYADAMERLIWNHVFAAQTIDGDCNRYDTPPNGIKPKGYFHGPDCCTGSGHRLLSMLPKFFYAKNNNAVFINQFVKSEAKIELDETTVHLSQQTDYPEESRVAILVNPEDDEEFTVNVRIPSWVKNPELSVNGEKISGIQTGEYASITREWEKGDKIELELPMELRWERRRNHMKVSDRKPYPAEEDPEAPYALLRGPIVYVLDNIWYTGAPGLFPADVMNEVKFVLANPSSFRKLEVAREDMYGPGYEVPVELNGGREITMVMYPFANIGIWYKDKLKKPDPQSDAYSYAIWLKGVGNKGSAN